MWQAAFSKLAAQLSSAMLSCSMRTKLQREFSSWIWAEVSERGQQHSLESGELSADF